MMSLRCLVVLLFGITSASAEAGTALERIKKDGKIVVATDPSYAPMEFETNGKVQGFEIDLINQVAERMGVKAQFVPTKWEEVLANLGTTKFDMIVSTLNINPERSKKADFVAYAKMAHLFVAKKGTSFKSMDETAGKVVAVEDDTTASAFMEDLIKKGLKVKELKKIVGTDKAFGAVKDGTADVVVADEPVARYYAMHNPDTYTASGVAIPPKEVGIAITKNEPALFAAVQKAIKEIKSDGTLGRLSLDWFGTELESK